MKSLAAILNKLNSPLIIDEIEIPRLRRGQVLVRMMASGICRSQLNEIRGFRGEDKYLPHLLGHEGSGTVEETGEGVMKVKKGDYAVASWIKGTGLEGDRVVYKWGKRHVNSGPIATFTSYSIISENRLIKISKNIMPEYAALLGCAIPTGVGIIKHHLGQRNVDSIIIFGVGGIGSSIILGAVMKGIKKIIAVDINENALDFARKIGATGTIIFREESVINDLRKICPDGADFAVEASGSRIAMEKAFEAVKDQGTLVVAGNLRQGVKIAINPFDLIKGKNIIGTWGGGTNPDEDIPYYVKCYLSGRLPLEKLADRKFRLQDINQAFDMMKENKNQGRMLLKFKI